MAGTELAGDHETVCHYDVSSKNTVFRDDGTGNHRPVAFIDWDLAALRPRIDDVADRCFGFATASQLDPERPDPTIAGSRMRLICDAYGLSDRSGLVDAVLASQDKIWRRIQADAEAGIEAALRRRAAGAIESIRGAYAWTTTHRTVLEHALA